MSLAIPRMWNLTYPVLPRSNCSAALRRKAPLSLLRKEGQDLNRHPKQDLQVGQAYVHRHQTHGHCSQLTMHGNYGPSSHFWVKHSNRGKVGGACVHAFIVKREPSCAPSQIPSSWLLPHVSILLRLSLLCLSSPRGFSTMHDRLTVDV